MVGQDHLTEFKSFASNLIIQYSDNLPANKSDDKRILLQRLDKAIFKMDNELTGRLTHIMALAAETPGVNENILERNLEAIKKSSIVELLRRNF